MVKEWDNGGSKTSEGWVYEWVTTVGNVSSVEHTLEFSNQGQMNLGYLFTNSYASLFEGHSWNFTSQALTLQSPENILRQKSIGSQKLCVKELSAGDLQGGWDTNFSDHC